MILGIRSDTAEATVLLIAQGKIIQRTEWTAGRQLSNSLLSKITESLQKAKAIWSDIDGVIVFEGPGSFTGLRISVTVANTIAYANGCRIVGSGGDDWITNGLEQLKSAKPGNIIVPHYGAEPNITKPKT